MIPWSIKHRLFGWHYVHARNTADSIVRRIKRTAEGERYFVYFSGHLEFFDRPGCDWTTTELTGDRADRRTLADPDRRNGSEPSAPPPPPPPPPAIRWTKQ